MITISCHKLDSSAITAVTRCYSMGVKTAIVLRLLCGTRHVIVIDEVDVKYRK